MRHVSVAAVFLTAMAGWSQAADEPVRIGKEAVFSDRGWIQVTVLDPSGKPDGGIRLRAYSKGDVGPWFGANPGEPARVSRSSSTWEWKGLKPGRYDLRFLDAGGMWVLALDVAAGEKKVVVLRRPAALEVRGTLASAAGPLAGAMVSAVSTLAEYGDRVIWKSWTRTTEEGAYRLSVLPYHRAHAKEYAAELAKRFKDHIYLSAQVFVDDGEPEVLDLNDDAKGGAARRFVRKVAGRDYYAGAELWKKAIGAKDPKSGTLDAGEGRLVSCRSALRLEAPGRSGSRAWVFVEGRSGFGFVFEDTPFVWRRYASVRVSDFSTVLRGLPGRKVLVVVGAEGTASEYRAATHRILDLKEGGESAMSLPARAAGGNLQVTLKGLRFDNEAPFAHIRRGLHLLPAALVPMAGNELSEAFRFAFSWKKRVIRLHDVAPGDYVAWVAGGPWLDTSKMSEKDGRSIPVHLAVRAVLAKLAGERMSPDHEKLRIGSGDSTKIQFVIKRES